MRLTGASEDHRAAAAAFVAKEQPRFIGHWITAGSPSAART